MFESKGIGENWREFADTDDQHHAKMNEHPFIKSNYNELRDLDDPNVKIYQLLTKLTIYDPLLPSKIHETYM